MPGNELSGKGIGARVTAAQYASTCRNYTSPHPAGGFFAGNWFKEFVHLTNRTLHVRTQHFYSLGAGAEDHLKDKILDPSFLNGIAGTFSAVQSILNNSGSSSVAWVSEAGWAVNRGGLFDATLAATLIVTSRGRSTTWGYSVIAVRPMWLSMPCSTAGRRERGLFPWRTRCYTQSPGWAHLELFTPSKLN
ncbi:hypothetical protein MLD38_013968 [Melastoma candidum]|uniref:Uncharacterized protein n=1 Tax=Melastoma candidum TaxID=119954 RepID=A0ACB9RCF1_9MYRT|nr:hypothetical protein MLD38_013968 [Melastoma candidum]